MQKPFDMADISSAKTAVNRNMAGILRNSRCEYQNIDVHSEDMHSELDRCAVEN